MGFSEARGHAQARAHAIAGVGFCFSDEDPYCGVDYDDCRDPATGDIDQHVRKEVERLNSYTEVSPSGTGVKVYCRGVLPHSGKRGSVEMYDQRRYFTVTRVAS
jgi:primase-polymerase (primpol)-like protein